MNEFLQVKCTNIVLHFINRIFIIQENVVMRKHDHSTVWFIMKESQTPFSVLNVTAVCHFLLLRYYIHIYENI